MSRYGHGEQVPIILDSEQLQRSFALRMSTIRLQLAQTGYFASDVGREATTP